VVAEAVACGTAIVAAGRKIVRPIDQTASEITAWFLDPVGNLLGIYRQRGRIEEAKGRLHNPEP